MVRDSFSAKYLTLPLTSLPGPECIEGTVSEAELVSKRHDQVSDNSQHRYLDEAYHQSRIYNLSDINVPVLSVANLGGILLHLRGNVNGYLEAGTPNKWLYFISGRHDLPFYLPHYVRLQRSCECLKLIQKTLLDDVSQSSMLGSRTKTGTDGRKVRITALLP